MEKGFFQGYTTVVWLVILLQVIENNLIFYFNLFYRQLVV
jgi:hypothetical protein